MIYIAMVSGMVRAGISFFAVYLPCMAVFVVRAVLYTIESKSRYMVKINDFFI